MRFGNLVVLDGILPNQADANVQEKKVKLPKFIPSKAIYTVTSLDDVDAMPRGSIAHMPDWDDDIAFDLAVAGATIILISRKDHDAMADHEDFDPDGYGIMDDDGLWLPGLDFAYIQSKDGWNHPKPNPESDEAS